MHAYMHVRAVGPLPGYGTPSSLITFTLPKQHSDILLGCLAITGRELVMREAAAQISTLPPAVQEKSYRLMNRTVANLQDKVKRTRGGDSLTREGCVVKEEKKKREEGRDSLGGCVVLCCVVGGSVSLLYVGVDGWMDGWTDIGAETQTRPGRRSTHSLHTLPTSLNPSHPIPTRWASSSSRA